MEMNFNEDNNIIVMWMVTPCEKLVSDDIQVIPLVS